ncbi:hypothetical protein, partial [Lacticaseibacillus paracasei]|uniref:phage adaptor protein n=1 Tax=Lacticaseibacillus paracasei TaxID=1597 RepID=UPI002E312F40
MDFGTLKADILALIGRAPADACYRLVTADINNFLRLKSMETTVTLTEAAEITLPTDFLGGVDVYRDTNPRYALRPTSAQAINNTFQTSGIPKEYAIVDGKLLLNPSPDGAEDIKLRYFAKVGDLVADGDTNVVLNAHPG